MEKKKKKILIVSNNQFYGGGEKFIDSTLGCLSNYYNLYFLVLNEHLFNTIQSSNKIKFASANYLTQIIQVRKVIKDIHPDLVLLNGGSSIFFSFFLIEKKIIIRHATNRSIRPRIKYLYQILLHLAYMLADKIVHVSNYSEKEQKFCKSKAICIHNGITISPYQRKYNLDLPIPFLFCSRVDKTKGIHIIVEAFKKIPPQLAVLHIVGSGDYMEELPSQDNIISYGFVKDVDSFYQREAVFIFLSEAENCPLSVLEAMNNGMPVLTSAVGGIPELVMDHYNGFFMLPTVEDVYNSIMCIVRNPSLISYLGSNSKCICREKFDIKDKILKYKCIIDQCINV